KGEPIVCHSTRFTLTVTDLDIAFVRDNGYHFYFLVTGSLRFTPKSGEFEDGLLKHLGEIEISLERAPLTADPRVLLNHISFQKALNPKKTFSLFNLFTFELRGFGFHPASPKFEGRPAAVNVSGQIRFAQIGDVMQPKIDFHGLWIAPPKKGESLPRIKADGLGVDLQLAGAVKVRGSVLAVDPDTRTVEGREVAPDGYNTYGFLGEGALDIPGWGTMEASLGFLEVEKKDAPGERKTAFFLYLQKDKLAVEIPTGIWTFYLREAGFGFGYRYTLAGIADAEKAKSVAQLVKTLDDVSRRQGDLARYSAWKADPEKDNFTLAMRAAFQPMVAQSTYDEATELKAVSPFFFDIVAALRSDFTFLMSARAWLGVNYATFLANKDNFRERPGIRGFLYISVPRSELLLRAIADSKGFIGEDFPLFAKGMILRRAAESVDWTTTLYIRPGLFHFEMGWPDQLMVRLVDEKNMRVIVRGGMIFRAAEDGLLFGFNIGAEAFLRFEGRAGSSIGVALVAELNATFVARVLSFTTPGFRGSLVYGLIALDARVSFSVEAWMEVDLGFTSFTLRIGFSFSLQLTAAVELAISDSGVGGRVAARVAVQVFGCSLGVGVGFSFNDRQLEAARAQVERFLAMSITAEEPASPPVLAATTGDKAIGETAKSAEAVHKAPEPIKPQPNTDPELKPSIKKSGFGRPPGPTDFYLVLRRATVGPDGTPLPPDQVFAFGMLVPKEAQAIEKGGFYAVPARKRRAHKIETAHSVQDVQIWKPEDHKFIPFAANVDILPSWDAPIAVPGGNRDTFTLGHFFDECFLADTEWVKEADKPVRNASNWNEPKELRFHQTIQPLTGSREERNQERERNQKAHAAEAVERPYDERAYQARSTVLTMFVDQFLSLAATGKRSAVLVDGLPEAHVTDLGLVLFGPVAELEKLHEDHLVKYDKDDKEQHGTIEVFNPHEVWFDAQDPILADDRSAVETDGIKLDWRLSMPKATAHPDHFIDHYEVLRTIEGFELGAARQPMRVKPSPTIGARKDDTIALVPPDWQFVDTLDQDTGVSPAMRRALLPAYGEAEGLDAAKAWLEVFGGVEEVTVTYSVTPVDCAGVRGLPRSFTVDVRRPQPPIRPAIGELRMVQTIPRDTPGAQNEEKRPENLQVFLALNDRAWKEPATQAERELTLKGVKYKVERSYRLVVDPEDVEPAGHYGSDAATSRVRGPGAFAPKKTADERSFVVKRSETLSSEDPKIKAVEPNDEERKNLPIWADLSKNKDLLDLLWQRPDPKVRVASRFFLETLVIFTPDDPRKGTVEHVSKRVALPVEHVIERPLQTGEKPEEVGQTIATLRPEAFEWAVPLVLPPLGEGQVHTESGFARFRVPKPGVRLGDLKNCGEAALDIARDPERRVLTTVRFAAVPDWAGGTVANAPKPLHGSSIAGFDLYELDLDDLAPLDVTTEPEHLKLADDASVWRRARRVARIEHLSREDARLVPAGNADWQGWQAHYPSETQRLQSAREGRPGESKPIRAAWYSDRETTPHFAERRPRLRLLPLVPETAIAELMRGGRPDRVIVSLSGLSEFAGRTLVLYDVTINGVSLQGFKDPEGGEIKKRDGSAFEAHDLRNLLLCLGWKPFDSKNPAAFDGLTLVVEAKAEFAKDQTTIGRVEIPLDFRSPLHPLLEEVIAELALDVRDTVKAAVYRRYTVMPQPVTPVAAKDFSGFMAATAPETDPYGWKVLQTLGTAVTVRLYDGAEEAFVAPEKVKTRVDEAFSAAIERWRKAYGEEGDAVFGQPFAEVFLRPGADRLAGPFDAVLKKESEAEEPPCLALDDQGLAFLQLSLRPRPARAWNYMKQELVWKRLPPEKDARLLSVAIRIASRTEDVDVLCDRTGSVAEVPGGGQIALIPIPAPREVNEKVTLYFRLAGDTALASRPEMQLVLELENRSDGKRQVQTFLLPNADAPIEAPEWQPVETPGTELLDPFDRFPAISAEKWAAAMAGTNKVAEKAFQSLRALVGTAFPADFIIPPPAMIAATYLTWTQRFLDHASSQTEGERLDEPCLAIAAPTKASPWKLAADGEGYLTLTFLHSDRWAHARAYAVRPAGRYHEVLAGIGIEAEERAEILEKAEKRPIGYAVAVSPRTERIEPPVIVQARLAKSVVGSEDPEQLVTEILVARHGEEALAASNRPLLARLGVPTSLLAFSRAYRAPKWPERLSAAFPDVPKPDLYPVRGAALPKSDTLAK
ncbi:MAG TPA: hypothetical protein VN851_13990, partial [Thermoanaerobaculia bacterium]|nr:hypothetical protein [Thermoanaerobaculia bacterium]